MEEVPAQSQIDPVPAHGEMNIDPAGIPVNHLSLEGMHGTVAVPLTGPGSGGNGARMSGRHCWSALATWIPATGAPTCKAGRNSNTTCSGSSRCASLMAIFLQVISARLGVVTGKDLAQCCRDWYPKWTRCPTGCCANSPSARVIWPKCSAARSP